MGEKKKLMAEKYFNDIKPKYLKCFSAETPLGNIIEGYICKKPNHYLGSMLITKINERDVEQFVQAMPKIHYYSYDRQMMEEENYPFRCREKLDGSCLILFGLYDNEGNVIEIVPKTRGVPVADKHIIELYNELDHANIEEFFNQTAHLTPTVMFELYGQLNQHSIFYPEYRISLALLGATFKNDFLTWNELEYFSQQYDFKLPNHIFTLRFEKGFWDIFVVAGVYSYYLTKDMSDEQKLGLNVSYPTQLDAINTIKDYITKINKSYSEVHGYSLLEGVVVNTYSMNTENPMFMKIKSSDIEERCRTENGIPRKFILKEARKYFDEYGSNAKEIYKKDDKHAYNYIMNGLSEEFDSHALENKKTKNRVKSVFIDLLEARQPPKGLQEICHEIIENYPDQTPTDYIRIFAQEYPEKKKQARMAFSIFETMAGD